MGKLLYLMRHAQSAERQGSQSDEMRELTPEGERQAARIGKILQQSEKFPEMILTSNAIRAKRTSMLVAEAAEFSPSGIQSYPSIYNLSINLFFDIINQLNDTLNRIMVVGHNPMISYVVEYLCHEKIGGMPPAAVASIEFDAESWKEISEGSGKLVSYISNDF